MPEDRTFNIGLALAGGATRGAYTAGVIDFLFQALKELDQARVNTPDQVPGWRVNLKTMAGTSAGGITAAVATAAIGTSMQPLSSMINPPDPQNNNLYDVWVTRVSSKDLFDVSDLNPVAAFGDKKYENPVRSFLNSDFPVNQANEALLPRGQLVGTPTWAQEMELYITTGNLRGVPFKIPDFRGADDELSDLRMTRHRDWIGFKTADSHIQGLQDLDLTSSRSLAGWNGVRQGMQATGTLPVIFPVAKVTAPVSSYSRKFGNCDTGWPAGMPTEFTYDAIDGGVFRNTPLELVRKSMEHEKVLTENVRFARGGVILVDPSPSRRVYETDYSNQKSASLLDTVINVLFSLVNDANFLDEEVEAVKDENNLTRFLIAPRRNGRAPNQEILATDTLYGFGGIIGKAQRRHDFQLGRRNAQHFLRNYFVVPLEGAQQNEIFKEDADRFAVDLDEGRQVVPILPLFGSAKEDCAMPIWPTFNDIERNDRRDEINKEIKARVEVVLESFAVNWGLYKRGALHILRNWVLDMILTTVCCHIMKRVNRAIEKALDNFKK